MKGGKKPMEKWLIGVVLVFTLINTVLLIGVNYPSADEIAKKVKVDVPSATVVAYNDSAVRSKLAEIEATVNKDANWKANAVEIANAEWSEKDYKAIYTFLVSQNVPIDDRKDITSISVKEEKVVSWDADDKSATVEQTLKVYYENSDGDKKKVLVDVTTTIADGEVKEQEFSL